METLLKIMDIKSVLKEISQSVRETNSTYGQYYRLADFSVLETPFIKTKEFIKEKRKFKQTIYKLKKQGLIKETKKPSFVFWKLTKSGIAKLKKLMEKAPKEKREYKKEPSECLLIVAFDIPESLRHLRKWLRASLIYLEFEKFQNSVWMGKTKLPEEFIKDIHKRKLNNYISIFKVVEHGTL